MISTEAVEAMIAKAANAERPDDAMKFAQAALNAANAAITLSNIPKMAD